MGVVFYSFQKYPCNTSKMDWIQQAKGWKRSRNLFRKAPLRWYLRNKIPVLPRDLR